MSYAKSVMDFVGLTTEERFRWDGVKQHQLLPYVPYIFTDPGTEDAVNHRIDDTVKGSEALEQNPGRLGLLSLIYVTVDIQKVEDEIGTPA